MRDSAVRPCLRRPSMPAPSVHARTVRPDLLPHCLSMPVPSTLRPTRRPRPAFWLYLVCHHLHMYCAVHWSHHPSSILCPIMSHPPPASFPTSSSAHVSAVSCIPAPEKTTSMATHAVRHRPLPHCIVRLSHVIQPTGHVSCRPCIRSPPTSISTLCSFVQTMLHLAHVSLVSH